MATIPEALNIALQHHRAGRLQEAETIYRQILQVEPRHPDALQLLGMIAHQAGRHDIAADYLRQAITHNPNDAHYHSNLGAILEAQGRLEEAVACYRQALALKPDYAEAHYNLGNMLKEQGRLAEAEASYRRVLALNPAYAMAYNNLGNVLKDQGRLAEAEASYRRALALNPSYALACNNLGVVLKDQGRLEDAVACYRQALELQPASAEAYYNLGLALQDQDKPAEAVADFRQAVALRADYAEAENQLLHQSQHLCEWAGLEELCDRQRRLIQAQPYAKIPPFTLLSIPSSPAEQLTCSWNWVANSLTPVARLREGLGFHFTRTSKPRLRIGYLSADFHQHATAYLIAELFELHDRSRFEVCAYSYGPDDGGEMRKRLVRACDRFVDVTTASYQEAARRIYEDGIDILADLKGYTKSARTQIVALRPAPIQVSYLGYPGTMGADFIDYIITDRFITPSDQELFFSENIVYLPDCYQINDRRRKIAEPTPTRKECGLPEQGFVWCCFNNTYKITPSVFGIWMRLLKKIPGSVLWLLASNKGAVANLRREASARGVNSDRLVFGSFVSLDKHLARLRVADLCLDTLPVNAHVTASDALWAGVPVLTCAGETFVSRVAGSLLTAIGLPELITRSLSEYEATALRLARSPFELAGLRERLAKNRLTAPLFDSERYARHLERAYQMMWDIYMRGEAPRRIEVSERQDH
jgi:predicted O-linked N-acetylglucosamine transferase (SPINDLY family)